jgi:hydrogenase nickel incorporation protein HypB
MCESCGCGDTELVKVEVSAHILENNQRLAQHNREHFAERGILAINLMGSPGAGKTAILEATARAVAGRLKLLALSGDLATDHDARRLEAAGIRAQAITTGTACHLDARLVHHALHTLGHGHAHPHHHDEAAHSTPEPLAASEPADLLFIENVGNLVCPAVYDLGQAANVVALSIPEGEDKPLKYPVMFHKADLVLITKLDLLPYLPQVRLSTLRQALASTMPDPRVIEVSAVTGQGIEEWIRWLEARRSAMRDHP